MQFDRSKVVRPSSDAGLTIETELVVYIWKTMQWPCFSLANVCIIIEDTSEFLRDYLRVIIKIKVSVGSRLTFSISISSRRV